MFLQVLVDMEFYNTYALKAPLKVQSSGGHFLHVRCAVVRSMVSSFHHDLFPFSLYLIVVFSDKRKFRFYFVLY